MTVEPVIAPTAAPVHQVLEVAFAPDPAIVSQTRRATEAALSGWNIPESITYNAVVAVSELVTNAIEHGGQETALRVHLDEDELHIEVSDGLRKPAELRVADHDEESGRGLCLVALLTERWGTSDDGATTWCTLRVPKEPR